MKIYLKITCNIVILSSKMTCFKNLMTQKLKNIYNNI